MIFENSFGIDLGSSTVKIFSGLKNRSFTGHNVIASRGNEIIAVGDAAYEMMEKVPSEIKVRCPMAFGMISDVDLQEIVLYSMLQEVSRLPGMGSAFYFSVPLDMTAIEKRAYYQTANGEFLNVKRIFMIEQPVVEAIALGLPMEKNPGSMVANIGSQTTVLSIISDGKVIISRRIPIGGARMNEAICAETRKRCHLQIGSRTAKRLKLLMGRLDDPEKTTQKIIGIDSISGLPREELISSNVVNAGIKNCMNDIAAEMKTFLERVPPQINDRIAVEGIHLTGGSSRLPFIGEYLEDATGYRFLISDLHEKSVLNGLEKIMKDRELHKWASPAKKRKL